MPAELSSEDNDQLEIALSLVVNTLLLVKAAIRRTQTKEEKRKLEKRRLRLEAERAALEAILDALADGDDEGIAPPTAEQVDEIAKLTGKVQEQTVNAATADAALEVSGKVLDLAMKLTPDD